MILNFIAYAEPKLDTLRLREALSVPEKTGKNDVLDPQSIIREDSITRLCRSLIRKSNDGRYYEFAHFSVKEFLQGEMKAMPEFEKFQVSKSICQLLLAKQCLKYLLFRNFSSLSTGDAEMKDHIGMRIKQHPFYFYAAVCWPVFAKPHWVDTDLVDLAGRLFQPKKTGNFVAWALELTSFVAFIPHHRTFHSISIADALDEIHLRQISRLLPLVIDKSFTTLHMAAALSLEVICSGLIREGPNIHQKSAFGCPLHCAVQGLYMALKSNHEIGYIDVYHAYGYWRGDANSPGFGREETIGLLLKSGETHLRACSGLFAGQTLITTALKVAYRMESLCAINVFLEAGHGVEEEDLTEFRWFGKFLVLERSLDKPDGWYTNSLESLILCLGPMIDSDRSAAHFHLCQAAWSLAVKMGCEFVQDVSIVDPRISLSQDALARKILKSIRDADNETLIEALKDPRADIGNVTDNDNKTVFEEWLHRTGSRPTLQRLNVLKILLSAGMEVNRPNGQGLLPLHMLARKLKGEIDDDDNCCEALRDIVGDLIRKGTGCIAQSRANQNVFHLGLWSISFIKAVLEAETDENTLTALRTQDDNGHTPIILALRGGHEDVALLLLETSNCDLESLRGPAPIHALCVAKGAHRAFNFLLDAGVTIDTCSTDVERSAIFHHLGSKTSKAFVLQLIQMFPDELLFRHEGKLPLDVYLQNCIESKSSVVDPDVLQGLATPRSEELSHQNRKMVWEGFALSVRNMRSKDKTAHMYNVHEENTSKAVAGLLRLGFLRSYEAMTHAPGILPLLEPLQDNLNDLWPLTTKTICEILDQTICWESLRECVDILKLLKAAVKSPNVDLAELLLQNGVSVHQRIDEMSVLEMACLELTKWADFGYMFRLLLKYANVSRLDEINPHQGQHMGLIHYLAGRGKERQLDEFIKRGADVNLRTSIHDFAKPAIIHHLLKRSSDSALILLGRRANPTMRDACGLDAALAAVFQGNLSFLLHLHAAGSRDWQLNWKQICTPPPLRDIRHVKRNITGANALHLAAWYGHCDILRFYLEKGLLVDPNTVSVELLTPIHLAALNGHLGAIQFLYSRGGDLGLKSADGSTPLHLAVRNGHTDVVRYLVESGSSMDADSRGLTPMAYAMQLQNQSILDCLRATTQFSDYQSEPRQREKDVLHAFEQALIRGDIEYCEMLRSQVFPINVDLPGQRGRSALMLAIENNKDDLIKWLLTHDAKGTEKALNMNTGQVSPLRAMVMKPALNDVLPILLERYERESGSVIAETASPICTAIEHKNNLGLKLLLDHTERHETTNS